jgi:peptidyl-dipeptidase Dcp
MSKTDNPLLRDWTTPYGLPPFEEISHDHILEAFDFAIEDDLRETKSIADNSATPDFANTIEGLERSGRYLRRVCRVVFNLTSAHTNEELQKIEREISPRLAKHYSELFMDRALFERIDQLYSRRSNLDLSPEQDRVLERYHTLFVRSGAKLSPEAGSRMAAINEKLAYLGTLFSQNVLKDESDFQLVLGDEKDHASKI